MGDAQRLPTATGNDRMLALRQHTLLVFIDRRLKQTG
jgi:hypothetical protein